MRPSNCTLRPLLLTSCLLAAAVSAGAQKSSIVLRQGDPILGAGGDILRFNKLAVSDGGIIYTNVQTTGDKSMDDVILLNAFLSILEGSEVATPPGAKVQQFLDLDVNSFGFIGWPLDLTGGGVNNSNDTGIYWNTLLLAREGDPIRDNESNGVPFVLGAKYTKFNHAKINDRNSVLFIGQIDSKQSLVLLKTDGSGNVVEEDVLFSVDKPFAPTGENVGAIPAGNYNFALSNNDGYIAWLKLGGNINRDSAIVLDGEIVAREGDPGPVPGRTWFDFNNSKIDRNDFGEYVFTGFLDNSDSSNNALLYVNGAIYAQKGTSYPPFGTDRIDRFDSVPMFIANSGDVYWYAKTTGSASTDQYFMRNFEVILRENITTIGNESISRVNAAAFSHHVSRSGRFWITEAQDSAGNEVIVLADFGTFYPIPGCFGNEGSLNKIDGEARAGDSVFLEMDDAQGPGARGLVFWSLAAQDGSQPITPMRCGLARPVGEILISLAPANMLGRQNLGSYDGVPIPLQIDIPNDPALVNLKAYGQGVWWDVLGTTGGPTFRLTNAMYLEIGAP